MASESPHNAPLAEDSAQDKPDSFKHTTATTTDTDSLSKPQLLGHFPSSANANAIDSLETNQSAVDNENETSLGTATTATVAEDGNTQARRTPPHSPAISLNSEACMAREFSLYEQDALDYERRARENGQCRRTCTLDNELALSEAHVEEPGTQEPSIADLIETQGEEDSTPEVKDIPIQQAPELEQSQQRSTPAETSGTPSAEENQMTQAQDVQFMQNDPISYQTSHEQETTSAQMIGNGQSSMETEDHDRMFATTTTQPELEKPNIPTNGATDAYAMQEEQSVSQNIPETNVQSNRQEQDLEQPMSQMEIPDNSGLDARHDDNHSEQRVSDNIPDSAQVEEADRISESDTTAARVDDNDSEEAGPPAIPENDPSAGPLEGQLQREAPVSNENGQLEEPEAEAGPQHWASQSQQMDRQESHESDQTLFIPPRPRVWEADRQAQECRRCNRRFNFLIRRHHCRRCGQVVCDRCSSHRIRLPPEEIIQDPVISRAHYPMIAMHPQRVCDVCVRIPVKETSSSSRRQQGVGPMSVGQMKRTGSSQSIMTECPVCGTELLGMHKGDQERHLQTCLNSGSPPVRPPRYIVYILSADSPQIGYECPICFEEFEAGQKIARMICLCSYHQSCLADWLERGKGCPVHFDSIF